MKIRSGFVSNSSSSSFVGFTTVEEHNKAIKKLSEEDRNFIEKLPLPIVEKFGQKFIKIVEEDLEDSYSINGDDMEDMFDSNMGNIKVWDKIDEEIRQPLHRYINNIGEMLDWSDSY